MGESPPLEILLPQAGIFGRAFYGDKPAALGKGPRKPIGGIAKACPQLQDLLRSDEEGELGEQAADKRPNDGEVPGLGAPFHLLEDGIPVRNPAVKVSLDVRTEHDQALRLQGFPDGPGPFLERFIA
jgi:hypothetical protein